MLNKPYIVLDNLLSSSELLPIINLLNKRLMPFYWHQDIDYEKSETDLLNFGFSHQLLDKSDNTCSSFVDDYYPIVLKACERLDIEFVELLRMRVILLTNVGQPHSNSLHLDLAQTVDYVTLVYYPETTDGDFVVCSPDYSHKIEPIGNRCIVMPKPVQHRGSNPITYKRRVVVNVNFIVQQ